MQTNNQFTSVSDAYAHLTNAIESISNTQEWLKYLSFQAKFHNYSFSNTLLIYMQNPNAKYVAGYKRWQELGRFVKKGEHSIKIFAPCKYKIEKELEDKSDDISYTIKGFKLVPVFDLAQTGGSEDNMPVLISGLKQHFENEEAMYERLIKSIDISVIEVPNISSKGSYNVEDHTIRIKSDMAHIQRIKTLFHEYSHHIHLTQYNQGEEYNIGELLAESSAYIICSYLGINTIDYSAGYIKSWYIDTKELKAVASKAQMVACHIINKFKLSPDQAVKAVEQETF